MTRGRPPRPPADAATVRRLRRLYQLRERAVADVERAADELAVAVAEACDDKGASRRQIAEALGVGTSTVQGWVTRGRQLRR